MFKNIYWHTIRRDTLYIIFTISSFGKEIFRSLKVRRVLSGKSLFQFKNQSNFWYRYFLKLLKTFMINEEFFFRN